MCDGEDGELKVVVWDNYTDTGTGTTYVSNFDDIRVDRNSMVFTIAFLPKGTDVTDAAVGRRAARARRRRRQLAGAHVDRRLRAARRDGLARRHDRTERDGRCQGGRSSPPAPAPAPRSPAATRPCRRPPRGLMRAVVLVGGFGTRLRPLTDTRPEADAADRPRAAHRASASPASSAAASTSVTLALGFRPEPFVEAFPDGRCGGVALRLRHRARAARHRRGDPLRRRPQRHRRHVRRRQRRRADRPRRRRPRRHPPPTATPRPRSTSSRVEDPSAFGVVERDGDGRVLRFVEKPPPGTEPSNLINAGTYVFEPGVLDRIPAGRPVSIERETFPLVAAAGRCPRPRHRRLLDRRRPARPLPAGQPRPRRRPPAGGRRRPSPPDASIAATADVVDSVVGSRRRGRRRGDGSRGR